jgi:hypothetical protein
LFLGGAAALVGTIPSALRAAAAGAPPALAWFGLAGLAGVVVAPAVCAARSLRPIPDGLRSVMFTVAIAFGPLVLFARVLWAGTHHRPLGAVTFSLAAAAVLAAVLVGVARLREIARSGRGLLRAGLWLVSAASVMFGLAKLPVVLAAPAVRAALLDGVLLLGLTGVSVPLRFSTPLNRLLKFAGPLVCSALALAAAAVLRNPELRGLLIAEAPVPRGPWACLFSL